MYEAKESGLPLRIAMSDPRAGGGMHMDYFGFNQGGDSRCRPASQSISNTCERHGGE